MTIKKNKRKWQKRWWQHRSLQRLWQSVYVDDFYFFTDCVCIDVLIRYLFAKPVPSSIGSVLRLRSVTYHSQVWICGYVLRCDPIILLLITYLKGNVTLFILYMLWYFVFFCFWTFCIFPRTFFWIVFVLFLYVSIFTL